MGRRSYMSINIKELRMSEGLTQQKLAEKIGITQNMVWHFENGKKRPDEDTMKKLSDLFKVQPEYFNFAHVAVEPRTKKETKAKIVIEPKSEDIKKVYIKYYSDGKIELSDEQKLGFKHYMDCIGGIKQIPVCQHPNIQWDKDAENKRGECPDCGDIFECRNTVPRHETTIQETLPGMN